MKRRNLLTGIGASLLGGGLVLRAGAQNSADSPEPGSEDAMSGKTIDMTIEEWKQILPKERFDILFREKTEPAWTSPLNDEKRAGTYICAACYQPLFSSQDKFDSGTGWPSFTRPISDEAIDTKKDFKLIWPRTEYHCSNCGGHQGHVFDDGPQPTGQRWCNNGLALEFVVEGDELPELRA
ncbi:MAG TPA: peptide-methionine (R)-S-oxide reductase MsrB [Wenzhouxiangellaceae bacterium]|nr:peptide-methionine (R)-S-oxide reductase MsrB [Wenzhouxiangellaceae bacterium]